MCSTYQNVFWGIMDWGCSTPIQSIFHNIQKVQSKNNTIPYQLPEPWNGDLENAKIVFVGLNPSFNPDEFFPKNDNPIPNNYFLKTPYWTQGNGPFHNLCGINFDCAKVEDFFENRFSGNVNGKRYVNNKLQTLFDNGSYSSRSVMYWKFVQDVMNYELKALFGKSDGGVMGEDCALMEIVPCKSKGCQGNNAKLSNGKTCIEDFTNRFVKQNLNVLLNDKVRLIVFVGKQSCKVWYDLLKQYCGGAHYTFNDIWKNHKNELFNVQGTKVKVVFAPHPSNGHNSLNKYSGIRGDQSTMTF